MGFFADSEGDGADGFGEGIEIGGARYESTEILCGTEGKGVRGAKHTGVISGCFGRDSLADSSRTETVGA